MPRSKKEKTPDVVLFQRHLFDITQDKIDSDRAAKKKTTLETIAKEIGVSTSALSKWRQGSITGIPNTDYLNRIAKYFNVNVDWLCGIDPANRDSDTNLAASRLTDKALQSLISIEKDYPSISSQVISSAHFYDLIRTFWDLTELAGIVDYMTEEIKSNSARAETEDHIDDLIRSLKYERYAFAEICVKILNDIHDIDKTISEAEKACSTHSSVN